MNDDRLANQRIVEFAHSGGPAESVRSRADTCDRARSRLADDVFASAPRCGIPRIEAGHRDGSDRVRIDIGAGACMPDAGAQVMSLFDRLRGTGRRRVLVVVLLVEDLSESLSLLRHARSGRTDPIRIAVVAPVGRADERGWWEVSDRFALFDSPLLEAAEIWLARP